MVNRKDYAAAHNLSVDGVVSHATSGSGPSASFLGSDMRAAYYGNGSLTGSGQTVGLLEFYGTDLNDLNTYFTNANETNSVPVVLFSVDGSPTSCLKSAGCDDTEQELDITQALGMAPGLQELTMYVGMSDTAMISAMTTHNPLPRTIGCSWGWTPVDPTSLDPYFKKMASQGQTFFAASGDSSTWSTRVQAWPADDPNVVSVGGTDLVTASAGGSWQSETAWLDSGGGITTNGLAIPSWQALAGVINSSNRGSTTLRNGPDVSANANFTFYTCSNQTSCMANSYGGTSFAAPMWAGYIALANQQLASSGQAVGFLNPTIYQQNVTASTFAANFHDIASGTSGSYSAVTGYDLVTGWGSPNAGLISALTGSTGVTQPSADFGLSAAPSSLSATVSATQGATASSTITTKVSGSFNSDVTLSASASSPSSGITVQFGTNPIAGGAGSSQATFTVPAGTGAGTYSFTITAVGGGITHTTTVSVTVSSSAPAPDFAVTATAPASVRRGGTTTSTVSTAAVNGFNSNVSLSASAGGGLSISFNPASIASGSGNSTMTITAARNAGFGSHTVTITASGGGTTHATTVTVTVTK